MIGKSVTGGGFKGVINYVTGKENAEILDQQNLWGNPDEWAKQMRVVANSRNLKNPVLHASLSLPLGETGTKEQWQAAAKAYIKEMGFDPDKTQYAVIRHKDTKHDHVHIVVNRVMLDNQVMNDFQHKKRTHEATRAAELAAGFQVAPPRLNHGKVKELKQKIDDSLKASGGNLARFIKELEKRDVHIQLNRSKTTGYVSGLVFKYQNAAIKGSSLGKEYSLGGLKKRGLLTEQTFKVDLAKELLRNLKDQAKPVQVINDKKQRFEQDKWQKERAVENAKTEAEQSRKRREAELEDEDEM